MVVADQVAASTSWRAGEAHPWRRIAAAESRWQAAGGMARVECQEGGLEMSEFDELVARPGVLMAGRFGPDGRVAEHETTGLYIENPAMSGIAHWFCAAVTSMFAAMAYAVDELTQASFSQTSWLPVRSWTFTGGDYM